MKRKFLWIPILFLTYFSLPVFADGARSALQMGLGIGFFSKTELEFLFRIVAALVLGIVCGLTHGWTQKSVSISTKTFAAVCLGSATFTSVMVHINVLTGIPNILNGMGNVMTGIGFVCAAVIFRKGKAISGLSTAATLWTAAGIGMACGSAMYGIAVVVTVIISFFHFFPSKIEQA
jgi:putative Mg2+ transporter-C (MgtC) family protein